MKKTIKETGNFITNQKYMSFEMKVKDFFELIEVDADIINNIGCESGIVHFQLIKRLQ